MKDIGAIILGSICLLFVAAIIFILILWYLGIFGIKKTFNKWSGNEKSILQDRNMDVKKGGNKTK